MYLVGPMSVPNVGGSLHDMVIVDSFPWYRVKFLKNSGDAGRTSELRGRLQHPPRNQGGHRSHRQCQEFQGEFEQVLNEQTINHKHALPDTPQYNRVVERALGLLSEKTITLQ